MDNIQEEINVQANHVTPQLPQNHVLFFTFGSGNAAKSSRNFVAPASFYDVVI